MDVVISPDVENSTSSLLKVNSQLICSFLQHVIQKTLGNLFCITLLASPKINATCIRARSIGTWTIHTLLWQDLFPFRLSSRTWPHLPEHILRPNIENNETADVKRGFFAMCIRRGRRRIHALDRPHGKDTRRARSREGRINSHRPIRTTKNQMTWHGITFSYFNICNTRPTRNIPTLHPTVAVASSGHEHWERVLSGHFKNVRPTTKLTSHKFIIFFGLVFDFTVLVHRHVLVTIRFGRVNVAALWRVEAAAVVSFLVHFRTRLQMREQIRTGFAALSAVLTPR